MTTDSSGASWQAGSRRDDLKFATESADRLRRPATRTDLEREVDWVQLTDVHQMLRQIDGRRWAQHDPVAAMAIYQARATVEDAIAATDPWRRR